MSGDGGADPLNGDARETGTIGMMWRIHVAYFGALCVLLAIPPASSTGLRGHHAPPVSHNDEASLELIGSIEPNCAITRGSGPVDLGDITEAGEANIVLAIDCNEHFGYQILSQNGGLAHQSQTATSNRFARFLPYELSIEIPTTEDIIRDAFTSAELAPGRVETTAFSHSDGGVAFSQIATLTLTWDDPAQPLLAGSYQDTLTLTVGAHL